MDQHQAERKAQADAITLTDPEQIATLPWLGNHYSDQVLFDKCDRFMRSLDNRDAQKRALYLMTLHGMGIDEPVSDDILDECLSCLSEEGCE